MATQRWTIVFALVGAATGLIVILELDRRRVTGPGYILPAVVVGAIAGGVYGFFRNKV
jgi:hypothetical protein